MIDRETYIKSTQSLETFHDACSQVVNDQNVLVFICCAIVPEGFFVERKETNSLVLVLLAHWVALLHSVYGQ